MVPRRPKNFAVGDARVRAVRGPKDGRWYWRATQYRDGGETCVWTGWATRQEAIVNVSAVVAGLAEEAARPDVQSETVQDLLELYVGHSWVRVEARLIKASTAKNYEAVGRRVVPVLGSAKLVRLDVGTLERFVATRARQGAAPRSIALELRVLRAAWAWGRAEGVAPDRRLDTPTIDTSERRNNHYTPTRDEIIRILYHLDGWAYTGVLLLWATGARLGELAELTWGEVHLDRSPPLLALPAYRTKTKRARVIPLSETAQEALQALGPGAPEERVWPVTVSSFRSRLPRHIARACRDAGVPRWSPHGSRRAAVDEMARAGVDIGTACAITGHSPTVMLEAYRNATTADVVAAMGRAGMGVIPKGKVVAGPWKGDG